MPEGSRETMGDLNAKSERAGADARGPVIAIDGPAGAGKSTVATALAREFGLLNLETGAMYRALALKALARGVELDDAAAMEGLTAGTRIELEPGSAGNRVLLDGAEVTGRLRDAEVTAAASRVSVHPRVRAWMVAEQRAMGLRARHGVVMEGRDIGTVVFPGASVKLFLDASVEERGERRFQQQSGGIAGRAAVETAAEAIRADGHSRSENGAQTMREEITREIAERDSRDRSRAASPLRPAEDAIVIDTTGLTLEAVVARASALVRAAMVRTR